jgi:hypothetical protein
VGSLPRGERAQLPPSACVMCVMCVMQSYNCLYSSYLRGQPLTCSMRHDSAWFRFMTSGFAVEHVWASVCC